MAIPLGKTLSRLVWLFLALVMVVMTLWAAWHIVKVRRSAAWPKVDGVVVASAQKEAPNFTGKPSLSVDYSAKLRYAYTVKGMAYEGTRISYRDYGGNPPQKQDAAAFFARYPLGAVVKVAYDPQQPADAVLETNLESANLIILALYLGFGLICWSGFVRGWTLWLRTSANPPN